MPRFRWVSNSELRKEFFGAVFLMLFLMAAPTLAQAGPIEDGVQWLLDLLTNGIARSVAIIALAVLGYMAFAGRLTWDVAIKFMVGVVFIFGGASIVDTFIGAVS